MFKVLDYMNHVNAENKYFFVLAISTGEKFFVKLSKKNIVLSITKGDKDYISKKDNMKVRSNKKAKLALLEMFCLNKVSAIDSPI